MFQVVSIFVIALCLKYATAASVAVDQVLLEPRNNCPPEGLGYLPHETLCNSYYLCANGAPNLRVCPNNLHWDNERRFCANPDSFQCDLRDLRCPEVTDPMNLVFLESSIDCARFAFCFDGVAFSQVCAEGFYWNSNNNACGPAELSECVSFTTEPTLPTPAEVTCPSDAGLFYISHPARCEFYFICSGGTAHFRTCAPGMIFDALNGWCDLEEHSICAIDKTTLSPTTTPLTTTTEEMTTTITEEETTTTTTEEETTTIDASQDPNDFPADVCIGINLTSIAHPNSVLCNFYIVCFMKEPTLGMCESGTIFSFEPQECLPGNVETCTFGINFK